MNTACIFKARLAVLGPVVAIWLTFTMTDGIRAQSDPLPGVDILVRCKQPKPWKKSIIGTPDLPEIPADFFGPGSLPFAGEVDYLGVCQDGSGGSTCSNGGHGRLEFFEGTAPNSIDIELTELELRSVDPIQVNVGGVDNFFDITYRVLPSPPGGPVLGSIFLDSPLTPGGTSFIVDSSFSISYDISFAEVGTGSPALGGNLTGTTTLFMESPGSVPIYQDPTTLQVIPGSDGGAPPTTIVYSSSGGGHALNFFAVPEPSSLLLMGLGLIAIGSWRKHKFPTSKI